MPVYSYGNSGRMVSLLQGEGANMTRRDACWALLATASWACTGVAQSAGPAANDSTGSRKASMNDTQKVIKSDEERQRTLTPEPIKGLPQKGAERALTGKDWSKPQ